jgi:uncharacterized membrane protein
MRATLGIMLLLTLGLSMFAPHALGQDYTVAILTLDVFQDGSSSVELIIEPDISLASVNVTLPGEDYLDLLVTDRDGIILDWSTIHGGVEIASLGSDQITVSYSTHSLTNKTGSTWSVTLNAPANPIITLPTGAVLVGLSPSPIDISVINNRAIITMPSGLSRITYLLGTTGTREHALVLLSEAEKAINEAKIQGLVVEEAELALAQARSSFEDGLYSLSEQQSAHASKLVQDTIALAGEAETVIQEANTLLQDKQGSIKQETIEAASGLIDYAEQSYRAGDYSSALSEAQQAYTLLADAESIQTGDQTLLIVGATLALLLAGGYAYQRITGKAELQTKPDEPEVSVNLETVFIDRPHLRTDDKAVLRFIQRNGGAFITEVRDHFKIPKSSAWRMARRLEDEGLIRVSKVGRETYLQLKDPNTQ